MFGRKAKQAVSREVADSPDVLAAVAQLRELPAARPELTSLAALYERLVRWLFRSAKGARAPGLSAEKITSKLRDGIPLLRGERLEFEDVNRADDWQELVAVISAGQLSQSSRSQATIDLLGFDPVRGLQIVLDAGAGDGARALAAQQSESAAAMSLLRLWALPRLDALTRRLSANWQQCGWQLGSCPACGSWPLLAEFRGLEQFRWLRCGLCGSGWRADRLCCPFCQNRDHRQLQDFFVAGEAEKYRVTVCERCDGSVRGISTLVALSAPALLVAEIETAHLDFIADRARAALTRRESAASAH